jgi:hypothetical protein
MAKTDKRSDPGSMRHCVTERSISSALAITCRMVANNRYSRTKQTSAADDEVALHQRNYVLNPATDRGENSLSVQWLFSDQN